MLLWTVGIIAVAGVGMWSLQRRLIYFPGQGIPPVDQALPGAEAVSLATSDGLSLGGWLLPPDDGQPIVIVFNGNAGTRAARTPLAAALSDAGLGVLLFDYRGYGDSDGTPSEAGLAIDARAVHTYAADSYPQASLIYFGESLGAAVAIGLAQEFPPTALILRSPFTSLAQVGAVHYPLLPGSLLRDRYPSDERIESIDSPVLVIAGSADSIVPVSQSRRIHELASDPKELLVIEGADHNDFALLAGDQMVGSIVQFITELGDA